MFVCVRVCTHVPQPYQPEFTSTGLLIVAHVLGVCIVTSRKSPTMRSTTDCGTWLWFWNLPLGLDSLGMAE